jgi:hypothetical protein
MQFLQKFIVTFYEGGEPSSWEYHVAVQCESIEELYSGLMDAAQRRVKFNEECKRPTWPDKMDINEWTAVYKKWENADKQAKYPIVCGSQFDIDSLIDQDHKDIGPQRVIVYHINENPDIKTLEQWFEEHKYTINEN